MRGSAARHGIGRRLWRLAEAHALAGGARTITIEASLAGVAFYRAQGFVDVESCEVRFGDGVAIPCLVMRKDLTGPTAAG